jgi:hypothetical protein
MVFGSSDTRGYRPLPGGFLPFNDLFLNIDEDDDDDSDFFPMGSSSSEVIDLTNDDDNIVPW